MIEKYSKYILETIRKAKDDRDWSISNYVTPLRKFYRALNQKEAEEFNSSLLKLLRGRIYIENLIDICRELKIEKSCGMLLKLFLNPPTHLEESGHPVWIEGLQRNIIYTLGFLKCKEAISVLKRLIDDRVRKRNASLRWDSYGVIINALASISSEESSRYFGWWLSTVQKIESDQLVFLKSLNDWKIMEENNAIPLIDNSIYGFSSVKNCIISVIKNNGLDGLKKWLKSITLYNEKDRRFLKEQFQVLADEKNELYPDLKTICKYKGKSDSLVAELSLLPRLKKNFKDTLSN
jgi:hypothetical protein